MMARILFALCVILGSVPKGCRAEDGFFRCKSGDCVHRGSVRDGRKECSDGSDENIEALNCTDDEWECRGSKLCKLRRYLNTKVGCKVKEGIHLQCRPDEFQCTKGKTCIPRWMVGDGTINCNADLFPDGSDEMEGFQECLATEFRCNQTGDEKTRCIPREWVMDGYKDCENGRDETSPLKNCYNETEFGCRVNGRCVLRYRVFDGHPDCPDGLDETGPLTSCIKDKEFRCLDNGRCIPRSWRGNRFVNCKDGSDEIPMTKNESCVEGEFRCHNDRRCIPTYLLCDGMNHCGDCSDEIESCDEPRMFRCPNEPGKCIFWGFACDAFPDCANGTDDIKVMHGFKCRRDHTSTQRYCAVPQWMLHDDFANCDDDSDLCLRENNTSTCTRCLDGKTVIASRQICDGIIDCQDFSDECLCSDGRSDKTIRQFCNGVSYTNKENNCPIGSVKCFEHDIKCLKQNVVCDGKVDCSLSKIDEILCTKQVRNRKSGQVRDFECDPLHPVISAALPGSGFESSVELFVPRLATRCNGITECLNFEDECSLRANCSTRLPICDIIPSTNETVQPAGSFGIFVPFTVEVRICGDKKNVVFGRSICNGVLECRNELDELYCSETRFACDAGTTEWIRGSAKVVSVPLEKRCDAKLPTDCVDQSDEINCPDKTHFYCENGNPLFVKRSQVLDGKQDCSDYSDECPKGVFNEGGISSREELIKSSFLQGLIWIMAFFSTFGNMSVAYKILKKLWKRRNNPKKKSNVAIANDIMIVNLSVADFLMGVVLFSIAISSQLYKGKYCLFDKSWRTSRACTAVGVTTVLSSQCSVFTLVALTSYRLYTVWNPIKSQQMRLRVVYVWIGVVWLVSFLMALLPLSTALVNSMVTRVWISSSDFFLSDTVALGPYQQFSKRISALGSVNKSTISSPSDWYGIDQHLRENFANFAPTVKGYFGYYSESSVCIPRLYLTSPDHDNNPMTSAVMTFNFVALMYIVIAYVLIYRRSTANKISSSATKKSNKLHKKITILVATDLTCWFPLCFMTFLSMGKVILPPIAYSVSAIVFLPINSSLNPIIYTDLFSIVLKSGRKCFSTLLAKFQKKPNSVTQASLSNPQTTPL